MVLSSQLATDIEFELTVVATFRVWRTNETALYVPQNADNHADALENAALAAILTSSDHQP